MTSENPRRSGGRNARRQTRSAPLAEHLRAERVGVDRAIATKGHGTRVRENPTSVGRIIVARANMWIDELVLQGQLDRVDVDVDRRGCRQ